MDINHVTDCDADENDSKTLTRKHIAERQRRARINSYLAEIRTLTNGQTQSVTSVKLEKAEVLERAVAYMKGLNQPETDHLDTNNNPTSDDIAYYRRGFQSCMSSFLDNLSETEDLKSESEGIKSHLASFIQTLTTEADTMNSPGLSAVQQIQQIQHQQRQGQQRQQQPQQQQQQQQQQHNHQLQQQMQQHQMQQHQQHQQHQQQLHMQELHKLQLQQQQIQQQQQQQRTMAHAQFQINDQSNLKFETGNDAIHGATQSLQNGGHYPSSSSAQDYQNYQMYSQAMSNYSNQLSEISPAQTTQSTAPVCKEDTQNSPGSQNGDYTPTPSHHKSTNRFVDNVINKGRPQTSGYNLSPGPRSRCYGDVNVMNGYQQELGSGHKGALGEMKTMINIYEDYLTSDRPSEADSIGACVSGNGLLQIAPCNRVDPDHVSDGDSSDSSSPSIVDQQENTDSTVKQNSRPTVPVERDVTLTVWRPWQ